MAVLYKPNDGDSWLKIQQNEPLNVTMMRDCRERFCNWIINYNILNSDSSHKYVNWPWESWTK